ncbi:MAG: ABC transporter permease [Thermoplasmata archaeon]|jgi:ABC-2 type transport system permease protein
MNFRRVATYFPAFAKGYIRNPLGLFFALIFPVILILIFGAVFSNSGSSPVPLTVQNLDHNSPTSVAFLEALNATGAVSISFVSPSVGNLSAYLADHSLSAGLEIPAGFAADVANRSPVLLPVYTNPASGAEAGIIEGAVAGAASGLNLRLAGGTEVVSPVYRNVGGTLYRYIDYLVPGLIGFSVLVSPMFSMVNISSTWKRDKLFRQLSLTPLTRAEWLTAALLWYISLACISAVLMVTLGQVVFGAHVTITLLALPFLVVAPILFVSLGLLAGSVSSTPESAGVVGNIITFPMMFLSGTFFPVSLFPPWLVTVAHVLPLYYVIDGLNSAMVYNNPAEVYTDLLVVLVVALVLAVLATRVFRWRED